MTIYVQTTDVCTQCRLCGERTPPTSPIVKVYTPYTKRVSRQYFCLYCWEYLAERARAEIPDLIQHTGAQAAQQLGVLLGIRTNDQDRLIEAFSGAPNTSLDLTIQFPTRLLTSRAPFRRWYPEGAEFDAHIAEAKKRMGHE